MCAWAPKRPSPRCRDDDSMDKDLIRTLIRDVIAEEVKAMKAGKGRRRLPASVRIANDADLAAFAKDVLRLAEDPQIRAAIRGRPPSLSTRRIGCRRQRCRGATRRAKSPCRQRRRHRRRHRQARQGRHAPACWRLASASPPWPATRPRRATSASKGSDNDSRSGRGPLLGHQED